MKSKKLSKIAAGTLLALSLLTGKLNSQENTLEESTLSKIGLNFKFELEEGQKRIDYKIRDFFEDSDFSSVNDSVINKISDKSISSYSSLLENSKSLTDNQKLVLLSFISNQLNFYCYDGNYNGEVYPQETFFEFLQDSFDGKSNSIGVCRHIAGNIEKMANDLGLRAAEVNGVFHGIGHAYDILKTDSGTSIIDSYKIITSKTKNIEKILEVYQKEVNSISFQHSFFEDSKFKYELITKDGENFLNFTDYDPSLNGLKDSLINKDNSQKDFIFELKKENNLSSFKAGLFGVYLQSGVLTEDLSSENKINLFQGGFKHKFIIPHIISIYPDVGFIYGEEIKGENKSPLSGIIGSLILATENKNGVNFSSRFSRAITNNQDATLFYKMALEAGISYTLPISNAKFEPYMLSQFSFVLEDLGISKEEIRLNELEAGLKFSLVGSKINFSLEPHYTKRIWEDEVGAKTKIGTKNLGLNLEGYTTKSEYDFCPNKSELDAGIYFFLSPMSLELNYITKTTDYSGEKENKDSFALTGRVSF